MKRVAIASLLCASSLLTLRADAAFHLMSIVEVFHGTVSAPTAQFIELQMYAAGQNLVGGHSIIVYNSTGTALGTFTLLGSVANGANQARILIATTQAQPTFGLSANLTMTSVIPSAGGKICFDTIDCVSWGNYSGPSGDAGTPFAAGTGLVTLPPTAPSAVPLPTFAALLLGLLLVLAGGAIAKRRPRG